MWGNTGTPADDVPTTSESALSHMPATATAAYHNHQNSDNSKLDDYDARPRIYLSSRVAVADSYTPSPATGSCTAPKTTAKMVNNNPQPPNCSDPRSTTNTHCSRTSSRRPTAP